MSFQGARLDQTEASFSSCAVTASPTATSISPALRKVEVMFSASGLDLSFSLHTEFLSFHIVYKCRQNKGLNGFLADLNGLKLPLCV